MTTVARLPQLGAFQGKPSVHSVFALAGNEDRSASAGLSAEAIAVRTALLQPPCGNQLMNRILHMAGNLLDLILTNQPVHPTTRADQSETVFHRNTQHRLDPIHIIGGDRPRLTLPTLFLDSIPEQIHISRHQRPPPMQPEP
jgi:hypothetical protein